MEVILDTNFIISCLLKRLDFVEQLKEKGFRIAVPKEVIEELKDLRLSNKVSHDERVVINVALEMLQKKEIKKIKLGKGKVDDELIKKGNEGAYIASLDAGIKRQVANRVVILSAKNEIGIERD
jgi:rRNA-processing protein FCF1